MILFFKTFDSIYSCFCGSSSISFFHSNIQWCDQWCHNLSVSTGKVPYRLPGDMCRQAVIFSLSTYKILNLDFSHQAKDERNYHIFYEMLAGLPSQQKQAFYLQEAETYYYLNQVESQCSMSIISFVRLLQERHVEIKISLSLSHTGRGLRDNRKE